MTQPLNTPNMGIQIDWELGERIVRVSAEDLGSG
jgi:hypothetical protein